MSWLEDTFASTAGWDHLNRLVDLDDGRMAGHESERQAAELTRDALQDAGAENAYLEEFEITGWRRGSSEFTHEDSGKNHETFALPRSPSDTVRGEFVDLGWGLQEDFEATDVEGKVVMVATNVPGRQRIVHRLEKYWQAVKDGAAGFVLKNHKPGTMPRSGTIRASDGGPIGEIPAVCVSYELGERLSRRFEGDTVTLSVDAEIGNETSQNVHAEVGPDTEEAIVVSCHIDGHDISESAGDNAAGTATVVEVANALATREDDLDTRVRFIGFGAEEVGLVGSALHAERTDLDEIKVMVQNDGVARARNLLVHTNGWDELETLANGVSDDLGHPILVEESLSLGSDHWRFVEHGVPAYAVASKPDSDDDRAFGSSSGIVITPADTLDKLDPRDLRHHAIIETEMIVRLADDEFDVSHRSPEDVTRQVDAEDQSIMRRSLRLPDDAKPW
jgi:Zn-dependent M28 family amino/carboxypeptidase